MTTLLYSSLTVCWLTVPWQSHRKAFEAMTFVLYIQVSVGDEMYIAAPDSFEFVTPSPPPQPIDDTTIIIIAVCAAVGLILFTALIVLLCCCIRNYKRRSCKHKDSEQKKHIPLHKVCLLVTQYNLHPNLWLPHCRSRQCLPSQVPWKQRSSLNTVYQNEAQNQQQEKLWWR